MHIHEFYEKKGQNLLIDNNHFPCSPTDQLWGIPVVLYFVWTVVLLVSSLIVVSCLQRETKRFHKRVSKTDTRGDLVTDIRKLEAMMARHVQHFLGGGLLDR